MHHSSVDADSGVIIDFDALHTREGLDASFATLPNATSRILRDANLASKRIAARHAMLLSALEAYGKFYGIEIEETDDILEADAAVEHLMNFAQPCPLRPVLTAVWPLRTCHGSLLRSIGANRHL
jgi:hypothetical protein